MYICGTNYPIYPNAMPQAAVQVQANPSLAIHLLTERGAAIEKIAQFLHAH